MNWNKAKTRLILFLLCTNTFLFSIIVKSYFKRTRVPDEVINSAVSLLDKRNIKIDSSIIPAVINSEKVFSVENIISDYESFAKLALQGDISPTETGFSRVTDFILASAKELILPTSSNHRQIKPEHILKSSGLSRKIQK